MKTIKDEQLIKKIKRLWFKREGRVYIESYHFYFLLFVNILGVYIIKNRFISFSIVSILVFILTVSFLVFILGMKAYGFIIKYKYAKQPHIYERNTNELWELKRELEFRGYEVKVVKVTKITATSNRSHNEIRVCKRES